ncbi:MAG: spermidine/putrescine ABC transporter substrate-binding protein [Alphaproteobacteria bacterium]|nr:spermidine/putrescine ABC transporter substrate-binding protein [Alphaproteobacteria bacterium]
MKRHLSLAFSAMTVLAVLIASTAVKAQEQIGGEINILSWGGYIDFALPGFEEKYGVKINIDYYGDEMEAMNKIRAAGLGTHDVVFLGAGFEDIAIKQGLIVPLDLKKLPAFEDVFPVLKKTKADGHIYCATYAFGLNSLIVYDPAKTGGPITSWADVYSGKYEGRIGKIDKADEQVWRTALSLNYKFGQLSEEQWAAVEARMVENTKQVRTVYSHNDQMAQLLANGEIWIADSDDGSYRQAKAKGLKIEVTYPEEGLTAWYDGPCIVAQAENEKAAYAFINYMVGAEVQASLPKELGYAPANKKGVEMVDAKTNADMGLDDLVKNIDKIQFKYDLGADFTNRAAEVWERAKAAAGK